MRWFHVAVRAYRHDSDLNDYPIAPRLWAALRHAFPEALAAVLMRNHAQLVTPGDGAEDVRDRTRSVVSGVCRSDVGRGLRFEPVSLPTTVDEVAKLHRHVRYIALNPARAHIVQDPLAWYWSTHRDVVGAVAEPWVSARRLAAALERPLRGFVGSFHAYVSGDTTTEVDGTPLPIAAAPSIVPVAPLGDILLASAAAQRGHPADVRHKGAVRETFFALAGECGWRHATAVAAIAGTSRQAVWLCRRRVVAPPAAWLCLGDRRLRAPLEGELRRFLRERAPEEWGPRILGR
jgi:hypothetical protein